MSIFFTLEIKIYLETKNDESMASHILICNGIKTKDR